MDANGRQKIIFIGFVVIFIVFAVTLNDKVFLNPNDLLNIVRQTAMIAVMAVAMTFVLSAGEIDLSVGAVAGLTTVTVALAISAVPYTHLTLPTLLPVHIPPVPALCPTEPHHN